MVILICEEKAVLSDWGMLHASLYHLEASYCQSYVAVYSRPGYGVSGFSVFS